MPIDSKAVLAQIDDALQSYDACQSTAMYSDMSDLVHDGKLVQLSTTLAATIDRFAPPGSAFKVDADEARQRYTFQYSHLLPPILRGILLALRESYDKGYLQSLQELVHADIFSDFLEMAEYLIAEGYKDPAAVLAGGVLEEHLRKLAGKYGVPIADSKDGKPRKASSLNDDLTKSAYDRLNQKSVTAWLDLRNKAAHGKYGEYDQAQVTLMILGVRDFMLRNPA